MKSIKNYLLEESYDISQVAVVLNGEVIKKEDFDNIILNSEDKIEVVSFVGGG